MKSFIHLLSICLLLQPFTGCTQPNSRGLLREADTLLHSGKTVSDLLSEPRFDSIRPLSEFRSLIKQHASVGPVTMVTAKEPGTKITVRGSVKDSGGKPAQNLLVYVYQTDDRGWYGADRDHFTQAQGDYGHARLFAWLKTDAQGQFEFNTIQPRGYPRSDLPAHIHIEIFNESNSLMISELLFDDDQRLVGHRRTGSVAEGFMISKPSSEDGKKIYSYTITLRK